MMSVKNQQIFVVIPTIRNLTFLREWGKQFKECVAIIVEDHRTQEIQSPTNYFRVVYHYTWQDIDRDFGIHNWIFSRKNAGIRSYGFYKAYTLGADVIITLDDDCYPVLTVIPGLTRNLSRMKFHSSIGVEDNFHGNDKFGFIKQHLDNLNFKAHTDWFPTYPDPKYLYTRGFPYQVRHKLPVVVSHGLWSGAIDLDAQTEVRLPKLLNEKPYPPIRQVIPFGYFFPMCSMNLTFRREVVPLMYFPLMGYDPAGNYWGYDRYDDIWAGLFAKKICDHLGWGVVNGSPFVEHRKASLPKNNLQREKPGLAMNESLWHEVKKVKLTKKTVTACYRELAHLISFPHESYFQKLREAMLVWISYFE